MDRHYCIEYIGEDQTSKLVWLSACNFERVLIKFEAWCILKCYYKTEILQVRLV